MMKDLLYLSIYLLIEILTFILGYTVVFGLELTKKKSKWFIALTIILLLHMVTLMKFGLDSSCSISFFSMLNIPVFLLNNRRMKKILLYPFVVIGGSILGVCISFIIAILFNIPAYKVIEDIWLAIICQSFSVVLMTVIFAYRKIKRYEKVEVIMSWKQYVILYAVIISLFLLLAPLQSISKTERAYLEINNIGLASSIACITLVMVTIWQAIISTREYFLQERNILNEKYIELQKEYYDQLIDQDENMRRFRHDINSHIQVLKALCEDGNNHRVMGYLDSIINESSIHEVKRYTGNSAVDAVIRKMLSDTEEDYINVTIHGILPAKIKIQEYDLCTIISNLFKNAIEACEKMNNVEDRHITLELGAYNSHFYMLIKNTVSEEVFIKNNQLLTTKNDFKNHGIGTKSVQAVVNKYEGLLQFSYNNGWFTAEINI